VPPSAWVAEVAQLRSGGRTALPVAQPPGFEGITTSTGNGLPLVSFHSTDEPTVTICTGPPGACRRTIAAREELRTAGVRGGPVLVLVEGSEDPAGPPLSDAARAFWSNVELTTDAPGWLPAP
jgi:hypothetical protein